MKITFQGWERQVYPHTHEVTPVERTKYGRFTTIERRKSVVFSDGMTALGKVHGLELTGNFLATFKFTEAELRSCLMSYFDGNPDSAQKLVSKVLADVAQDRKKQLEKSFANYAKLEQKLAKTAKEMQKAVDKLHEQWLKTESGSSAEKQLENVMNPLKKYLSDNVL